MKAKNILNIKVYLEGNKIKLQLIQAYVYREKNGLLRGYSYPIIPILENLDKQFNYIKGETVTAFIKFLSNFLPEGVILPEAITLDEFDGEDFLKSTRLQQSLEANGTFEADKVIILYCTALYCLPTDPQVSLDFINILAQYLNGEEDEQEVKKIKPFTNIQFNPSFLDSQAVNDDESFHSLLYPLENYLEPSLTPHKALEKIIQDILNMSSSNDYQAVHESLNTIYTAFKQQNIHPLSELLKTEHRFSLMNTRSDLAVQQFTEENSLSLLLRLVRKNIIDKRQGTFSKLIELSHADAKRTLVAQCLGKDSLDGKTYSTNYTECRFLMDADFYLRFDKKLVIRNIQDNPSYKEYYAEGKQNYDIFESEMRHWAKQCGLEFHSDTKFPEQIVFTSKSSDQLAPLNLHMTVDYLKNLLEMQNKIRLYQFGKHSEKDQENAFRKLPNHIFAHIINYHYPDREYELSKAEIINPSFNPA